MPQSASGVRFVSKFMKLDYPQAGIVFIQKRPHPNGKYKAIDIS
ncbi:hypothetical protein MIZ03_1280 [Rhodoferax lithotrophicus]|uniref:Uncharacterized protein n=1 Tax=Rhodoferax lithotrophicus TaxID=2798804 RepID=A0ABN6D4E6_9BURK|nr:hypothetical protein MIZ03_1280 [Rhodoferax sp. MIZ03]